MEAAAAAAATITSVVVEAAPAPAALAAAAAPAAPATVAAMVNNELENAYAGFGLPALSAINQKGSPPKRSNRESIVFF